MEIAKLTTNNWECLCGEKVKEILSGKVYSASHGLIETSYFYCPKCGMTYMSSDHMDAYREKLKEMNEYKEYELSDFLVECRKRGGVFLGICDSLRHQHLKSDDKKLKELIQKIYSAKIVTHSYVRELEEYLEDEYGIIGMS